MVRMEWEPDEIDFMLEYFPYLPTADIAKLLGRTMCSVSGLAGKLDLHKDPELLKAMSAEAMKRSDHGARRYQFRKGHMPLNKGVKNPGFAPGRMGTTQFKKGQVNHNVMPIGSTRWVGSGTGGQERYLYRKVSDVRYVPYTVNWKAEHILIWEKMYGPVPRGYNVIFKDGNRGNFALSNLEMVSRGDWMRLHTVHNLPEELKEVIRLKGSIKRVITRRRKHAEKQDERPT